MTWAMIETPHDKMYLAVNPPPASDLDSALPSEKTLDQKLPDAEPELLLVKRPLITSSLRKARRHLTAHGGFAALFRGLGLFVTYQLVAGLHRALVNHYLLSRSFWISSFISDVLASVIVSRLMTAWTHIVISQPSSQWWGKRLPKAKIFLQIAKLTAIWALAEQATIFVPAGFSGIIGLPTDLAKLGNGSMVVDQRTAMIISAKALGVFLVALATVALIQVPATVALTRVQASMLPETELSIVPFDRTFDGRVMPTSEGGRGQLGMLEAWKTFDWAARRHLFKFYVKVAAVEFGISFLCGMLLLAELRLVLGERYNEWMTVVMGRMGGAF